MFVSFRKVVLVSLVLLTVLTTGAWQNNAVVSAQGQAESLVETPLYPGLTWSSLGFSNQDIRINIQGDTISVSGERFEAREQFLADFPLPQDLVNYYSSQQLAKSGWTSYDSFDGSDGVHYVFYHESGVYLSVEYIQCQSNPARTCVAVWKSKPADSQATAAITTNPPENLNSTATGTFSKTSPVDGATGVSTSVTLKWGSYSSAYKYTYCVETSDCASGTSWSSTYDTSAPVSKVLSSNTTYYWQVRALTTCESCTPKVWVYANNSDTWTFKTQTTKVIILGNAGVGGAVLSYVDVTAKTVTAGSDGSYSIAVPYNWSGTVTPSKAGYVFSPRNASFSNLTAAQTIQNFTAGLARIISGNVGIANATLSYIDGAFQTTTSNSKGDYVIIVATGWTGTVTPTHSCFTFNPASNSYSSIAADQTLQNFAPVLKSGCADISVAIKGANQGRYGAAASSTIRDRYTNVSSGPVKVVSTNGEKIVTSERAYYANSFNEVMGTPVNQFTTEYWFPWYDQIYMKTWILVGNPSTTQTAYVDIYIGGTKRADTSGSVQTYSIAPGGNVTPVFPGIVSGPVRVVSVTGTGTPSPINIFASERALYGTSFNEVMGYPTEQFSTEYWFPWYDQVYMKTWVLVGNPSTTQTAYVNIYIGGTQQADTNGDVKTYAIPPGGNVTPVFPGIVNGPVRVVSVTGPLTPTTPVKVFASERSLYGTSFNEVMGYPTEQLTTDYYYTWYDNQSGSGMTSWLLVGNPSSTQTAYVDIYINGVKKNTTPYVIAPNGNITPQFTASNGVVKVVSVTGPLTPTTPVNIFSSERTLYGPSFNEMMGYPGNQLTSEYWFPWYDNLYMNTSVFIGKP